MPNDPTDAIQSLVDVLRGELADANDAGDFAGPLADLRDAARALDRPGAARREHPIGQPARDLDRILTELRGAEQDLRRAILDHPERIGLGPAAIALGDLSRAINAMIAMMARRQRRTRA